MPEKVMFKWLRDERYTPAVDVVPEADGPRIFASRVRSANQP